MSPEGLVDIIVYQPMSAAIHYSPSEAAWKGTETVALLGLGRFRASRGAGCEELITSGPSLKAYMVIRGHPLT
jgi:hypothetical protein